MKNCHKSAVTQCKTIAANFGVIDIVSSARGIVAENTDATEARGRQSSVSSLSAFFLELLVTCTRKRKKKKRSDPNRASEKTEYRALTVSAGAYVMSCPALSDPVRSPKYLP